MKTIEILITNKIAIAPADAFIVCGNSEYKLKFIFDAEWTGYNKKVARFIFGGKYIDANFEGDTCKGVVISNTREVVIGVYADNGELATSTGARIDCKKSVLCDGVAGTHTDEVIITKGDKGDSAYEVAVKNGFEGTEAEWLESLKPSISADEITLKFDNTLKIDNEGFLGVNLTTLIKEGNELPITSGAVALALQAIIKRIEQIEGGVVVANTNAILGNAILGKMLLGKGG